MDLELLHGGVPNLQTIYAITLELMNSAITVECQMNENNTTQKTAGISKEFLLAVKVGLPNYFDYDSKTNTITPKSRKKEKFIK